MTDTDRLPADQRQPMPRRYPDGSDPDLEDDLHDLDQLFESLRRTTL